ncbi:unnamed protein product [Miscanthus lutarioriparius]|uniref:cysteine dioxygenase n=1 Tax=Miscanthus lutarioriparius TaxID=422564 RepID=A0A811N283_9POAL|nr:unnamed protein product [Miscanthus lutarioriparius]
MDANAIQKFYEVCKVSLSEKGPLSSESLDNVRAVLDMITPADVGLECEAEAVRVWRSPRALSRKRVFHSSPAIRYRHIYECKSFSIGIFCIPASSIIPLHNHPGMTVLSKILYGTAHVKSYDWIDTAESLNLSKVRPAKVVRDGEMSAPCGAMVLHPGEGGGNIHALKAITPCAILDILTPPYSSENGRHCSYFRRCPRSDPSGVLLNRTKGSEFVWLEEYQPHDNFIIRRDLYAGPALKL